MSYQPGPRKFKLEFEIRSSPKCFKIRDGVQTFGREKVFANSLRKMILLLNKRVLEYLELYQILIKYSNKKTSFPDQSDDHAISAADSLPRSLANFRAFAKFCFSKFGIVICQLLSR